MHGHPEAQPNEEYESMSAGPDDPTRKQQAALFAHVVGLEAVVTALAATTLAAMPAEAGERVRGNARRLIENATLTASAEREAEAAIGAFKRAAQAVVDRILEAPKRRH
jgi:hypothetical protein